MRVKQQIAYLQGMAQGMRIPETSQEGRVIAGLIDVLYLVADDIERLHNTYDSLEGYVEAVDADLAILEADYYEEVLDEEISLTCPRCGEDIELLADELDEELDLVCPNCNQIIHDYNDDFIYDENTDVIESGGYHQAVDTPQY